MTRKRKDSNIFEGTFLEGLMDLDETKISENLPEVSEEDKVIGALLPVEIKLQVFIKKKNNEILTFISDVNSKWKNIDPDRKFDEIEKILMTIVAMNQQYIIAHNQMWTLVIHRLNQKGFSLFPDLMMPINSLFEIKKGFVIVIHKSDGKYLESRKSSFKSFRKMEKNITEILVSSNVEEQKDERIKYCFFLFREWSKILYGI
mgnify:CR=1 FL=1